MKTPWEELLMRKMPSLLSIPCILFVSGCMETMYCDTYHLLSIPARCSPVAVALREDHLAKLHTYIHDQRLEALFLPSYPEYPFHLISLASINTLLDLMSQPQNDVRDLTIKKFAKSAVHSFSPFSL